MLWKIHRPVFLLSIVLILLAGAGACSHPVEESEPRQETDAAVARDKHGIVNLPDAKQDLTALRSHTETETKPYTPSVHEDNLQKQRQRRFSGKAVGTTIMPTQPAPWPSEPLDQENYAHYDDNPVKQVAEQPLSTFSIDVDTGAYSNVRRFLTNGQLPRTDVVRAEEMINYFDYHYPSPENTDRPFSIHTEMAPAPWRRDRVLLHIGLKGYQVPKTERPAANLVFLIDVSGSMQSANKLELLKTSLKMLAHQLNEQDHVAIVVYAGASGVVLEPTSGRNRVKILQALDRLTAGGATNGAAGIRLAYQMAAQEFIDGGINRVLLATDGDFNVGTVNFQALKNLVEKRRESGITLTTLGFGSGNFNDHLMEQLADSGNGNYAYIDTAREAQKVLVEEMQATLLTIAKDVKIQIEFNPAVVSEYRLIGYENRILQHEDFNNDKIDAGDIGAGHTVTALYELTLTSQEPSIDKLRYSKSAAAAQSNQSELAYLKLRYKNPDGHKSKLIQQAVYKSGISTDLKKTSDRFRFSAAVAAFAQLLRNGKYTQQFSHDDVIKLANNARGTDSYGYRGEFVNLVRLSKSLHGQYQQVLAK